MPAIAYFFMVEEGDMKTIGMRGNKVVLLSLCFASCFALVACSGPVEEKTGDGGVEQVTSDAAEVVVDKIKSPIDAARMTKGLADKRLELIDKELQEQ